MEQHAAALEVIAAKANEETPRQPDAMLIAFQEYLQLSAPWRVVVPYAATLAKLLRPAASRGRIMRDFERLLSFIKAVAIIRHAHRERTPSGSIIATLEDYATVRHLLGAVFSGAATGATEELRLVVNTVATGVGSQVTRSELVEKLAGRLGRNTIVRLARDVLLDTGIRVTEAAEATVGDFIEVEGKHYLALRVKGRKRRGEEKRYVPVSPAVARVLVDALLARGLPDPGEPLLVNASGRRWTRTYLSETMSRIGAKAGIKRVRVSAHKLRHTANVLARVAGLDTYTRSALLTHSSTNTVARYDHLVPGELHEARQKQADALQKYLGRASDPQ